jgi:hypothetical protein
MPGWLRPTRAAALVTALAEEDVEGHEEVEVDAPELHC